MYSICMWLSDDNVTVGFLMCSLLFTWPPGLFWRSVSPSPGDEKPNIWISIHNLQKYEQAYHFPCLINLSTDLEM